MQLDFTAAHQFCVEVNNRVRREVRSVGIPPVRRLEIEPTHGCALYLGITFSQTSTALYGIGTERVLLLANEQVTPPNQNITCLNKLRIVSTVQFEPTQVFCRHS